MVTVMGTDYPAMVQKSVYPQTSIKQRQGDDSIINTSPMEN